MFTNETPMYRNEIIHHTLDNNYMTRPLKNAQITEFKQLKSIIEKAYSETKKQLTILDIGVGYGRIPLLLSKDPIWQKIKLFVGFDNSQLELNKAKINFKGREIRNKSKLVYFDARNLNKKTRNHIFRNKYDLIICTFFTAGNFKPPQIELNKNKTMCTKTYPKKPLMPNKEFVKIFRNVYKLLTSNGKIILTVYIQCDESRVKQEEFYKKCHMTVITGENDLFTATKEGFWSQRFSKEMIYNYFSWVQKRNIEFIPLDFYNFAQMVIISKNIDQIKHKAGSTPLIWKREICVKTGCTNVLIKDESKNPFGTLKDRRSELILDRALEYNASHLCLITSGNAGYSLARTFEDTTVEITNIVDKNLRKSIKDKLKKYSNVIEVDLSNKVFSSQDVIKISRKNNEKLIWDVTNGFHQAYEKIVEEIKYIEPDFIFIPIGSGEAFIGICEGIKKSHLKTRVVGIGTKTPKSFADKLYTPWTPYKAEINKNIRNGHKIIRLKEDDIKSAYSKFSCFLDMEPSSSVVFGALEKLKLRKNSRVILVNSGKGLF